MLPHQPDTRTSPGTHMNNGLHWIIAKGRLELVQGDLTKANVDAIVNAANSRLAGGGGVDGAIHRAAGPELLEACMEIVARQGHLEPGGAVITPGFNLPARFVIHTVGPIWRGGGNNEERTLRNAYANSLARGAEAGAASMAFPAISCGVYGYPVEQAARIALTTLRNGIEQGAAKKIAMYLFSEKSFNIWAAAASEILGPPA